jgi:hypothetical protein
MLTQNTVELRKLILENPELPIAVFVGENANTGDYYYYQYCNEINFQIQEILDCDLSIFNGYVYTDRDDFENYIADKLAQKYKGKSDKEYEEAVQKEIDKYEPYWKKVIAITVDN